MSPAPSGGLSGEQKLGDVEYTARQLPTQPRPTLLGPQSPRPTDFPPNFCSQLGSLCPLENNPTVFSPRPSLKGTLTRLSAAIRRRPPSLDPGPSASDGQRVPSTRTRALQAHRSGNCQEAPFPETPGSSLRKPLQTWEQRGGRAA